MLLVLPSTAQQTENDKFALALAGRLSHVPTITLHVLAVGKDDSMDINRVWQHFVDSGVQTIFEPSEELLKRRLQDETQSEDYSMAICGWGSPFIETIREASKQPILLAFSAKMRASFLEELRLDQSAAESDPDEEDHVEVEEDFQNDEELFIVPDVPNNNTARLVSRKSSVSRSSDEPPARSGSKATISVPALGIVDQPQESPKASRRTSRDISSSEPSGNEWRAWILGNGQHMYTYWSRLKEKGVERARFLAIFIYFTRETWKWWLCVGIVY